MKLGVRNTSCKIGEVTFSGPEKQIKGRGPVKRFSLSDKFYQQEEVNLFSLSQLFTIVRSESFKSYLPD